MTDGQELLHGMRQYHGGDTLLFNAMNPKVNYTEGVRFFMQNAGGGAYWLLTILLTQPEILKAQKEHGIVFVRLKVAGNVALLMVNIDSGEPPLYQRFIDFTDCPERPVTESEPEGEWLFYFENDTIMLPAER